jgi:hypothetical protein
MDLFRSSIVLVAIDLTASFDQQQVFRAQDATWWYDYAVPEPHTTVLPPSQYSVTRINRGARLNYSEYQRESPSKTQRQVNGLTPMKKTIRVAEIVADLDQEMPDEQLMKKYQVSRDGLETLLANLLKALANGASEIEAESGE